MALIVGAFTGFVVTETAHDTTAQPEADAYYVCLRIVGQMYCTYAPQALIEAPSFIEHIDTTLMAEKYDPFHSANGFSPANQ